MRQTLGHLLLPLFAASLVALVVAGTRAAGVILALLVVAALVHEG